LRILAFRLRVERGTSNLLEISLRIEVIDVETLGTFDMIRIWFLFRVLSKSR